MILRLEPHVQLAIDFDMFRGVIPEAVLVCCLRTLQINSHITDTFTTFELMDIHFRSLKSIRVQLIYRPPDNISCVLFLEEFSVLLEQIMAESTGHLLIIYLVTSIYMLMTPVASMQSALMKFLNHAT